MPQTPASRLRISLVIPAYNEERYIGVCLRAATTQTQPFHEIIVVDNNSTDKTAAIAGAFPGVRVIKEPQQGKVYARTAGFNAATGDIIGRIDADTRLPQDWTIQLERIFEQKQVAAVTGSASYYGVAWPRFCTAIERFLRGWLAYTVRPAVFLQGANMAIRRSAWLAVRGSLCDDRRMHEDYDIAIHLYQHKKKVVYDKQLVAGLSARPVDVSLAYFVSYMRMGTYTYAKHQVPHYRRMYPVLAIILLLFFPMRFLIRHRTRSGGFSFKRVKQNRADQGDEYLS